MGVFESFGIGCFEKHDERITKIRIMSNELSANRFDMFHPDAPARGSPELDFTPSFSRLCPDADPNDGVYIQISVATPDPRTIKTHLPFSLFHPSLLDTSKVTHGHF